MTIGGHTCAAAIKQIFGEELPFVGGIHDFLNVFPVARREEVCSNNDAFCVSFVYNQEGSPWPPEGRMQRHPNKHIHEAIEYAVQNGWAFVKAGPRSHDFGALYCPHRQRDGCIVRVYSNPKEPENHARWIRRQIDRCPHEEEE